MDDPIVVTGTGLVTPLGVGTETVWNRLLEGQSGICTLDRFDVDDLGVAIAGLVPLKSGDAHGLDIDTYVSSKDRKKIDLFTLYAIAAADEALLQAGWAPEEQEQLDRTATVVGTGIGGFPVITDAVRTLDARGPRRISPFVIPAFLGNLAAGNLTMRYGFRGPIGAPVTACAAGLQGIGDAIRMIRAGEADVALAGGTEACLDRLTIAGFSAARALSTDNDTPHRASRPYDASRNGFVLAEGAGMIVIERLSHALARRAKPLFAIAGYGTSADAYHLTAGPPDGGGAALAMQRALQNANLAPEEVGYINGHATSTPLGDAGEITGARAVFGKTLNAIPISSTKSATGHLLGAAGAVATIFSGLALATGSLPATLNFKTPDKGAEDLDFIPDLGRRSDAQTAMCNAFGFGGVNASLVLQKLPNT